MDSDGFAPNLLIRREIWIAITSATSTASAGFQDSQAPLAPCARRATTSVANTVANEDPQSRQMVKLPLGPRVM